MVEALGLANVTLQQLDILELSAEFGQFDYLIANGLYSWVPAAVRDQLLSICKTNLAPQGIAYVSYNAYPGSHLRDILREMLLFHVREVQSPAERVAQARALTGFLASSASSASGASQTPELYRTILASFEKEAGRLQDGVLFHDHLARCELAVLFPSVYTRRQTARLAISGRSRFL